MLSSSHNLDCSTSTILVRIKGPAELTFRLSVFPAPVPDTCTGLELHIDQVDYIKIYIIPYTSRIVNDENTVCKPLFHGFKINYTKLTVHTYIIERSNDNSTTTTAACLQLRFVWLQFCVKLVHFGIYRPLLLSSCYIGDRWGRVLQHLVHICV